MPNNNSKKQSIYKPTSGKRLSKKRIYKLLKKDKMNGGGILDGLSAIFGGDPEKIDESKSSGVEPPSHVETSSEETVKTEDPLETPSVETEETVETPSVETEETVETPSVQTSSEEPESNIDGQGNITKIDNTLSVSDETSPSVFDDALDATKAVATTAVDSAKNTFNEISDAVTTDAVTPEDGDTEDSEEEGDDMDVSADEDDDDDDDEDKKLMEIIADQNKTINNQNTTIDNLNQTIKEQSNKLVEILETQITNLKQTTTDDNTIQYPPVNSPMSIGSPSMSTDTNSPMGIGSPSMSTDTNSPMGIGSPSVSTDAKPPMIIGTSSPTSPGNTESLPNRTGVGGKTKGRRSTKKRRSK